MALFSCHKCGWRVNDQAPQCPYCGAPVRAIDSANHQQATTKVVAKTIIVVLSVALLVYTLYNVLHHARQSGLHPS